MLASIGPDGTLLVDTGDRKLVPALLEELKALGGGSPRIVVNSHSHAEHWDGNLALGRGRVHVGHENLRRALRGGPFLFLDLDDSVLPARTTGCTATRARPDPRRTRCAA